MRNDRSVEIEERPTSVAQFERVPVDLTGVADWRAALARIETALERARAGAVSEHLVARLVVGRATPLAFRLRRDRDLLLEEAERRAEAVGKSWIDRVELAVAAPADVAPGGDPPLELGALMRATARGDAALRGELRTLIEDMRGDLPHEARGFAGDDEAELDAFLDKLAADGAEEALARFAPRPAKAP